MKVMMVSSVRVVVLCAAIGFGVLSPGGAQADVWVCEQEDGSELFTDGGFGPCRLLHKNQDTGKGKAGESARQAFNQAFKGMPHASAGPATGTSPVAPQASVPAQSVKAAQTFLTAIHQVPVLMVSQLSAQQESQGFYLANRGEVALVDLAVSYASSGTGPEVSTDSHFGGNMDISLRAAVAAAAKAVGYDPRFLRVRLSVKTSLLQSGLYIDGPSAGAVLAVGVASALLGDQIRPDVCMSGTINEDLDVGPVGGLEEKIKGCRQLRYREMVVPFAQTSMDLVLKGKGSDIRITEVSTFDAAYQAATGRALRTVTLP